VGLSPNDLCVCVTATSVSAGRSVRSIISYRVSSIRRVFRYREKKFKHLNPWGPLAPPHALPAYSLLTTPLQNAHCILRDKRGIGKEEEEGWGGVSDVELPNVN
jgi:hypothetical protein